MPPRKNSKVDYLRVYPGLNDFSDALEAIPETVVGHLEKLKEIDARSFQVASKVTPIIKGYFKQRDTESLKKLSALLDEFNSVVENKVNSAVLAAEQVSRQVNRLNIDYEMIHEHEIPQIVQYDFNDPAFVPIIPQEKQATARTQARREAREAREARRANQQQADSRAPTPVNDPPVNVTGRRRGRVPAAARQAQQQIPPQPHQQFQPQQPLNQYQQQQQLQQQQLQQQQYQHQQQQLQQQQHQLHLQQQQQIQQQQQHQQQQQQQQQEQEQRQQQQQQQQQQHQQHQQHQHQIPGAMLPAVPQQPTALHDDSSVQQLHGYSNDNSRAYDPSTENDGNSEVKEEEVGSVDNNNYTQPLYLQETENKQDGAVVNTVSDGKLVLPPVVMPLGTLQNEEDNEEPPVGMKRKRGIAPKTSEPVYCYCQQGSFGEMVGCDGPNCEREWFHLDCIGLSALPKGQWFCEECRAKLRRR